MERALILTVIFTLFAVFEGRGGHEDLHELWESNFSPLQDKIVANN